MARKGANWWWTGFRIRIFNYSTDMKGRNMAVVCIVVKVMNLRTEKKKGVSSVSKDGDEGRRVLPGVSDLYILRIRSVTVFQSRIEIFQSTFMRCTR